MKSIILIFILTIFVSSCGNIIGYDLNFNQIDSYSFYGDYKDLFLKEERGTIEKNEKELLEIVFGKKAYPFKDTSFLENIEFIEAKKSILNKKSINSIRRILQHREISYGIKEQNRCAKIYRDILVLRKNGKITGIAKICFQCSANIIITKNLIEEDNIKPKKYKIIKKILSE